MPEYGSSMSTAPGSIRRSVPPSAFKSPCRAKLASTLSRKRTLGTGPSAPVVMAPKGTVARSMSLGSSCGLVHRFHLMLLVQLLAQLLAELLAQFLAKL